MRFGYCYEIDGLEIHSALDDIESHFVEVVPELPELQLLLESSHWQLCGHVLGCLIL